MDSLREHFEYFTPQSSPVYTAIAQIVATQPAILDALSVIPLQHSPRTVFLAAIHAVLLSGAKHALSDFYPTVGGQRIISDENLTEFKIIFLDFYRKYQTELKPYYLKNTQTNEAKRSFALLPGLSEIIEREKSNKLSLIEIGTSAGFLLNLDKYGYKINNLILGNKSAKKIFETTWTGKLPENLKDNFIIPEHKIGIDINPINIENKEEFLWLKALTWPEHVDRMENLDFACEVLLQNKKELLILKGTLEDHIDKIMSVCADSKILCFYAVWVFYQLSESQKESINNIFIKLAKTTNKKIYFMFDDMDIAQVGHGVNIILRRYDERGDYADHEVCAACHHGSWIERHI
ncbi:MAG TPA: DUF2332 domain-containing protein [Gammaproteobacteria bacterium]|nr:DUF2332 domain-containing protein [Gammaproteobacteria bacterium]